MDLMEKLGSLCKRRGFIFPSSEIYGGLNGCWDYGPLGVELKRNIKEAWWRDMVVGHDDLAAPSGAPSAYSMVGLDCAILMNPQVWQASGHVTGFADLMVDCKACKSRFRADNLIAVELIFPDPPDGKQRSFLLCGQGTRAEVLEAKKKRIEKLQKAHGHWVTLSEHHTFDRLNEAGRKEFVCPECDEKGQLTEPRKFNLMFETFVGALRDESAQAFLRPETAQGIFVNFKNVCDTSRVRVPFGIAQIGKAFRNEINPRNFTFRSREFEQMEIEFFCRPETADAWYAYWRDRRYRWYVDLGLQSTKLRLREHRRDELAHYAASCADVEYEFPFGISELEGIANRTDFDLKQHTSHSGKDLSYFDDQEQDPARRKYIPYVIEPSAGADRAALAFLCEAYAEDEVDGEPRTVLKFHPRLAPIKAAVFPLVKKDGMPEKAQAIYRRLRNERWNVFYDDKGAIGRRYRRQDEAGTPFCITIDGQTLQDDTVTVRDRDSTKQERVAGSELVQQLCEKLAV